MRRGGGEERKIQLAGVQQKNKGWRSFKKRGVKKIKQQARTGLQEKIKTAGRNEAF